MKLPNLLIAGAPKCGTSSIFTWLIAHPEVCGSQPKETFYLMNSDSPLCNSNLFYDIGRLEKYSQYFDHCSYGQK